MQHNGSHNGYPQEVPHIEPLEISDDELREQIAQEVETRLGMDFSKFIEAYEAGTLPDTLDVNELVILLHFLEYSGGIRA